MPPLSCTLIWCAPCSKQICNNYCENGSDCTECKGFFCSKFVSFEAIFCEFGKFLNIF